MFQLKEVRNRTVIGPTSRVEEGVSTVNFPFAIIAKSTQSPFGKVIALVAGDNYEDAKNNARQVMQSLQITEKLVTLLTEVKLSDI